MNRKDYILIAAALSEVRTSSLRSSITHEELFQRITALDEVTVSLASRLRTDNPLFNLDIFFTASGMKA